MQLIRKFKKIFINIVMLLTILYIELTNLNYYFTITNATALFLYRKLIESNRA